mmetsp:Transcript_119935/g.207452  ORF Transcript_119935/g.207452 Transcript_119935/m.207452 type:complete len:424 (-) Transcript_119935:98-1369(-)
MDPALMAALLGAKGGGKGGGGGGGGLDPSLLGGMMANIWENPMVSNIAFHPTRIEPEYMDATEGPIRDGVFDVAGGDKVSYRLYLPPGEASTVVYFWHGNAEVCTNVDYYKDFFLSNGTAVLSLDYRGFSWGSGQPSLTKLCGDAEACFSASLPLLEKAGCGAAKKVAMGRSIGATCAVHIASKRASKFQGLIIDNGLMSIKGLPMVASMGPMIVGGPEQFAALQEPFDTLSKLAAISCPLLVMYSKGDEIIPFSQGQQCYEKCASSDKSVREWATGGHNEVCVLHMDEWSKAIIELLEKAKSFTEPFPAGALVEAHSLSTESMNGLQGRVLGPKGERYCVDFGAAGGEKALKPANLKVIAEESSDAPDSFPPGAEVEAHSLSNADFNGLRGKVLGPKGDRVNVEFPEPHGAKALKPANLKLV